MKKIYFVVMMLLVCTGSFAQKVNIKKNIISLDDVQVGMVEKFNNKETKETGYTYSDLKGENKFTMVRYYLGQDSLFFVVRPDFTKDTAEIKMQYLHFTLNEQNGLTELLIKKYNFFDKNGMNVNAINEYLSAKHEPQIPLMLQHIQEQKQTAAQQKQMVRNMDIRAINDGTITSKGESAGSFAPPFYPNKQISQDNPILVKDEAGNVIAKITAGGEPINDFNTMIVTYDNNTFKYRAKRSYDKQNPNLYYQEVAEFLASKEYLKGQRNSYLVKKAEYDVKKAEYTQMQKEKAEAQAADLKARTEVEGILTLKDGTKIKGTFQFNYRQTEEGRVAPEGSIADLDAGKIIFYLYRDEKGKNKVKKYSVKDVSTFYINDNEIYESVTYKKGNLLREATSGGSLDVGKLMGGNKAQKFLLQLAVTDKARLYFSNGEYILMKPGSEDAITGKTLNTADLAKFASDCPVVSQKIVNNGYGSDTNSYKQLVEDYTKCN